MSTDPQEVLNLGRDSSGRPLLMDRRSLQIHELLCQDIGFSLTIVQGSFSDARASGNTHLRAGVWDIRSRDLGQINPWEVLLCGRRRGLAIWYRTAAQGFDPHFHAIDIGNADLSYEAEAQVRAYRRGRNGLANNGPDDGPRVPIRAHRYRDEERRAYPQRSVVPTINYTHVRRQALTDRPVSTPGVRVLQRMLNMVYGLDVVTDGVYGPQTRKAVRKHEQAIGRDPANGIIDRQSLQRLSINFKVKE